MVVRLRRHVEGNDRNNVLEGTTSNDRMYGLGGNDILKGDRGHDSIVGGAGNDQYVGGDGDDTLDAVFDDVGDNYDIARYDRDGGDDGIVANLRRGVATDTWRNTDRLFGINALVGTHYGDRVTGSSSDDYFSLLGGDDTLNGGGGIDILDYSREPSNGGRLGIVADLDEGTVLDGFDDVDRISGIEILIATRFDDDLMGDNGDNIFRPMGGSDTVDGRGGYDTVDFSGRPNAVGRSGVSVDFFRGHGRDGFGNVDHLHRIERVIGSSYGDKVRGDDQSQTMEGGGGNDSLAGGYGDDTLAGDAGNDQLAGDLGDDGIAGGDGNDRVLGGGGNDSIAGEAGDDEVHGGDGRDLILGGGGVDNLTGDDGGDTIDGGDGDDRIRSGEGPDVIDGGDGRDTIVTGGGADVVRIANGGHGDTILDYNSPADTLLLVGFGFSEGDRLTSGEDFVPGGDEHDAKTDGPSFMYDDLAAELFYDPDGVGPEDGFLVARFQHGAKLSINDFTFG